jgi:hypothetical protein
MANEEHEWRSRFLAARVHAGERAQEVCALLFGAADQPEAVTALARLLVVDERAARGVLDNWSGNLSLEDRQRARAALG